MWPSLGVSPSAFRRGRNPPFEVRARILHNCLVRCKPSQLDRGGQPMLTLAGAQRIGGFTVFRDSIFDGAQRSVTSTFYVLSDTPRLSSDATGGPAFDFLWYRSPPDQPSDGAGGLVTLTVDLAPTAGELATLEQ